MKILYLNSKKIAAKINNASFTGKMTEVEKIASSINQYGNIMSYEIQKKGNSYEIIFILDKEYNLYKV